MPEIPFVVNVRPDPEDGGYIAATPMLAGVYGQGNTKRQAVDDLEEALAFTLGDMVGRGEPLPEADSFAHPSDSLDEDTYEIQVAV